MADERHLRQILMTLVARSGDAALKILEQIRPDLILLDAVMPGMDGFAACRTIKEQDDFALVPIVFMTGLDDSEHVIMGLEAGGVDYVTKPIKPGELIARVSVHVANARMIRDARQPLDGSGQSLIAFRADSSLAWASPRAIELLGTDLNALCAHGNSNKDIATILNLSPRTVTKHVEQIFRKVGVENRTAAAMTFNHLAA